MKHFEINTFPIAGYFLPAIINDDYSALTDDEAYKVKLFLQRNNRMADSYFPNGNIHVVYEVITDHASFDMCFLCEMYADTHLVKASALYNEDTNEPLNE